METSQFEDNLSHSKIITKLHQYYLFHICSFQDPTSMLLQLAEQSGMAHRFHALSLGQGQAPIATRMIKEGVREVSKVKHH